MRPDFGGQRRIYLMIRRSLSACRVTFFSGQGGLLSDAASDDKVKLMEQWRRPYRPPSLATPRP
jgi:hypothetical protein